VNGAIAFRDVTAQETRSAGPGEIVTLPQKEIDRLVALNLIAGADLQVEPKPIGIHARFEILSDLECCEHPYASHSNTSASCPSPYRGRGSVDGRGCFRFGGLDGGRDFRL
jgi:hypothetical protein